MLPRARRVVLAACLGAGALALARSGPATPRPVDSPAHEFSAQRARDRLAALLADEAPHPVGSAAGAAVRARLIEQLRALGLAPEEQAGFSCTPTGGCAPVVNVLVRVPGREPGPALLLASHHDSVAAGPGAADDGHGVAIVLESLRALLADGPPRRPLMAVFTDGEEAGLLGARLFVQHPAFAEVGVVLNVEARGTGGAARMFETSDGNAALIAAYAEGSPRPSAHSLSYEIYRRLPNDTDLTIFKQAGAQGLGFAFIGGVRRYHTPRDDLAHLDLGSVQQQGDSLLGTARALLEAGVRAPAGNATYADLLGLVVLRWPAAFDLPLAGLALLLLGVATWRARRPGRAGNPADSSDDIRPVPEDSRGRTVQPDPERSRDRSVQPVPEDSRGRAVQPDPERSRDRSVQPVSEDSRGRSAGAVPEDSRDRAAGPVPKDSPLTDRSSRSGPVPRHSLLGVAAAAGSVLLAPLLAAAATHASMWLVERVSGPIGLWPAAVTTSLAAAVAFASVAAVLVLRAVARRVGARAQALGVWLMWAALAVVIAVLLPGASILWICPALAAGLGLVASGRLVDACAVAGGLTFALWAPLVPALVDALGLVPAVVGALVGFTWSAASPGLADAAGERLTLRCVAGLAIVALVLATLAGAAARIDADQPGKLNLLHVTDLDSGAALHVLDAPDDLPEEYLSPGTGDADPQWQVGKPVPWSFRDLHSLAAPVDSREGPSLTVERSESLGELREVHATLRARPGALALFLVIPDGALDSLELGGHPLDPTALREGPGGTRVVTVQGPPAAGVSLVARLRGDAAWTLADGVAGPAPSAAALVRLRPAHRVPYQMGDLQIALRAVRP